MIDAPQQHRPLFDALSAAGIDYRLVRSDARLTTILVKQAQRARVPKLMKSQKYKALLHPYSKWYGYHFLYQMKEFQLYARGDALVELYFALPCMSLTPKTWMPLDKSINDMLWLEGDVRDGAMCLDAQSEFIYRLTQCVFARGAFDESERAYFKESLAALDEGALAAKLQAVFFRYTQPLMAHLQGGAFDRIVPDYLGFTDY